MKLKHIYIKRWIIKIKNHDRMKLFTLIWEVRIINKMDRMIELKIKIQATVFKDSLKSDKL